MTAQYQWKQVGASFRVNNDAFPKCYGIVRRNGKVFYRNYKRPLKNGGLSLFDIYEKRMSEYALNLSRFINTQMYADANV